MPGIDPPIAAILAAPRQDAVQSPSAPPGSPPRQGLMEFGEQTVSRDPIGLRARALHSLEIAAFRSESSPAHTPSSTILPPRRTHRPLRAPDGVEGLSHS